MAYIKVNTIEYFVFVYNTRMLEITINNSSIISTDKTLDENKIKNLNDLLDEKIDKSKSFEGQIDSLTK